MLHTRTIVPCKLCTWNTPKQLNMGSISLPQDDSTKQIFFTKTSIISKFGHLTNPLLQTPDKVDQTSDLKLTTQNLQEIKKWQNFYIRYHLAVQNFIRCWSLFSSILSLNERLFKMCSLFYSVETFSILLFVSVRERGVSHKYLIQKCKS